MNILHRLKPRVAHLNDFYVWDTETGRRVEEPEPGIKWELNARPEAFRVGVIYGWNYTKVIHSLKELHETFLEPRFNGKKVYAHNAFYDLTTGYGNIFTLDPKALFIGARLIAATNGNCIFCDSFNIVSASVADLGKMIGKAKPDLGGDEMFTPDSDPDGMAKVINRCTIDCQIVWDVLFDIFEFAGNIKLTQASLSMHYFLANHLPFSIEHSPYTKHFWDSYFGGRTEALKIGKTHSQVIDANSEYPYMMSITRYPNPKFLKSLVKPNKSSVHRILKDLSQEGCIYATVKHEKNWIGYLPIKKDGKLIFPVGTFTGCWNFNEFRNAINSGVVSIVATQKIVYGLSMESPFIDYVKTLYDMRVKSKDPLEVYRIKIFMNSLYGKFGQRIKNETEYIADMHAQLHVIQKYQQNKRLVKISVFNPLRNDCFLELKRPSDYIPAFAIPSFASYTTSAGRVYLLNKMIEMKPNRPVYCDTDSIFFEIGTAKSEYQLGGWKVEDKIVTEIRGLKNYSYIDSKSGKVVKRIKGVPKKAIETAPNVFEFNNLIRTKEALRRGLEPGVLTTRKKVISGKYEKRVIFSNGETEPIEI